MAQAKKPAVKKAAPKKVQVETTVSYEAEAPVVAKAPEAPVDTWEIKDRVYVLATRKTPIIMTLPTRHTAKRPLLWFDEAKGYEREIRYATNQRSIFVDEQEGHVTLTHIVFRDGTLFVPKAKQALQKLLSLYHPLNGVIYKELDEVKNAVDELDYMDLQLEAANAAANMEIDLAEAILRVEVGNAVSQMKSKEIRRDVRVMARNNPQLFLELANDENIELRNVGVKAVEAGVLELANDQRTIVWKATNRKIMTVPFGENPYSALAAFFKTDDGIEIYQSIVKRI
jgi:hypothetical protein